MGSASPPAGTVARTRLTPSRLERLAAVGSEVRTPARIENYLGLPAGLSGSDLASRAVLQARKFGVRLVAGATTTGLSFAGGIHEVTYNDGRKAAARNLIIATGAHYRKPALEKLEAMEGSGVFYAATSVEAASCESRAVAVLGAPTRPGRPRCSWPGPAAACTCSSGGTTSNTPCPYLIKAVRCEPRIQVHYRTEIAALRGDETLSGVEALDRGRGTRRTLDPKAVFVLIGATPCTQWLDGQLATDGEGFLLSGLDLPNPPEGHRPPAFETDRPGVFCIGDGRSGSVKRVAAAVGEGSAAVRLVFDRLTRDRMPISG